MLVINTKGLARTDCEFIYAGLIDLSGVQSAIKNGTLTEEDVMEEARNLCKWVNNQKVLDYLKYRRII